MLRSRVGVLRRQVACRFNSSLAPAETKSIDVNPDKPIKDVVMADTVLGAPESLHHRIVRIYKPAKTGVLCSYQVAQVTPQD